MKAVRASTLLNPFVKRCCLSATDICTYSVTLLQRNETKPCAHRFERRDLFAGIADRTLDDGLMTDFMTHH